MTLEGGARCTGEADMAGPSTRVQRLGVAEPEGWAAYHWWFRHFGGHLGLLADVCVTYRHGERCGCRVGGNWCCEHANAADGMCEPCRRWCALGEAS